MKCNMNDMLYVKQIDLVLVTIIAKLNDLG